MDKKTQLWNLYQQLKGEITLSDTRNNQIKNTLITASGVIITIGFHQENPERPWIILCVLILIIPLYGILFGNRKNIWRISTYLRTFIEPELEGVQWETHLDKQRNSTSNKSKKNYSSEASAKEYTLILYLSRIVFSLLVLNLLFFVIIDMSISYKVFIIKESADLIKFVISALPLIISIIFNFTYISKIRKESKDLERLGSIETNFLNSWKEIEKEEKEEARS